MSFFYQRQRDKATFWKDWRDAVSTQKQRHYVWAILATPTVLKVYWKLALIKHGPCTSRLNQAIRSIGKFAEIGTKVDGEYRQLNNNVLQNRERALCLIRPKRVAKVVRSHRLWLVLVSVHRGSLFRRKPIQLNWWNPMSNKFAS